MILVECPSVYIARTGRLLRWRSGNPSTYAAAVERDWREIWDGREISAREASDLAEARNAAGRKILRELARRELNAARMDRYNRDN